LTEYPVKLYKNKKESYRLFAVEYVNDVTEDISRSVFSKSDGYFEVLSKDDKLQGMFKKAINEIYNPNLIK
jgi:hypothetical protein